MNKFVKYLIPSIYFGVVCVMVISILLVISGVKSYLNDKPKYKYTIDDVFISDVMSVSKTNNSTIIKPYIADSVKIKNYFYDVNSSKEKQEQSLIEFKNIYFQNNGVDYINEDDFDVVSVLDGEVINVEDNEIYNKVLTIKYNDDLKIVYSNLSNILITVGYKVSQGEIIGTSTISNIDNKNSLLHFEVYYKNKPIDPESIYNMDVNEIE